jgi:hypothetical protein
MNDSRCLPRAPGLATLAAPRATLEAPERGRNEVMRVGIYLIFAPDRLVRVLDLPESFRSAGLVERWEDSFAALTFAMPA